MGAITYYTSELQDHLFPECPALRRSDQSFVRGPLTDGLVNFDPYDPTVCGWCQRVYRARKSNQLRNETDG